MQCRARAGAETLGYIWTTDQLLADAFQRFVKVSRVNRRYGSHVPGPLEARRRGAKRRMGMAATMVDPGVSGFIPALMTGIRMPTKIYSPESSWQWLQPNPPPPMAPQSPAKAFDSIWEDQLAVTETGTYTTRVNKSKEDFEKLLDGLGMHDTLTVAELHETLEYLRSSEDEPEARNLFSLIQWLSTRSVSTQGWAALGETVSFKVQARNMSVGDIAELIELWKDALQEAQTMSILVGTLDALGLHDLKRVVWSISRRMLEEMPTSPGTLLESAPYNMTSWLAALRKCAKLQGEHAKSSIWNALYRNLSRTFHPSALRSHFGTLDETDLARVLLRHWTRSTLDQPSDWVDTGGYHILRLQSTCSVSRQELYRQFEAGTNRSAVGNTEEPRTVHSGLRHLLTVLISNGMPYDHLTAEIFAIISETAEPDAVTKFIDSLATWRDGFVAMTPRLGSKIIDYLVQVDTPASVQTAYRIASMHGRIPVSAIQELPIALIDHGFRDGAWTARIFALLNRKTDTLRPEERQHQRLRLHQDIVGVVHRMATKYASAPELSPRTAFRRVWTCYRFLRDRRGKIRRAMSGALVKAGIFRKIEAGERIPQEQLKFILSVVELVEGHKKAKKMDQLLHNLQQDKGETLPGEDLKAPARYWKHRIWRNDPGQWFEDRREPKLAVEDHDSLAPLDEKEYQELSDPLDVKAQTSSVPDSEVVGQGSAATVVAQDAETTDVAEHSLR